MLQWAHEDGCPRDLIWRVAGALVAAMLQGGVRCGVERRAYATAGVR